MTATTNSYDDSLAIALAHAALGREVFPLIGKQPAVPWQSKHYASTSPDRVKRLWMAHPGVDGVAWRIAPGLVVLDVDDPTAFAALVPNLPDAPGQRSRRGFHRLYRDPGVTQGRVAEVADVKVGGKGYVKLYAADAFQGDVTSDLPAEVVRLRETSRAKATTNDPEEPMGSRDELLSFAGRLRRAGLDTADILAALLARYEDGRIVDLDESKPWTNADFKAIAKDIGSKPVDDDLRRFQDAKRRWDERKKAKAENRQGETANRLVTIAARDLLAREFRPLVEPVPGLVVEGLGMLIGGPKKGKSWLAYQIAVAVATGGEVLGKQALKGDVLYLALEDGERRAQDRVRVVLAHTGQERLPRDAAELEIGFNANRGDELVVQVEDFLVRYPGTRLVIVDTLQKIRPASNGRRGAYELDAEDIGRVQAITQRHPGLAIMVVHHDRKEAVSDFLDAASGTHGITGSVDTGLLLRRDRHESQGTLDVTGRDVREDQLFLAYDEKSPFWTIDPAGGLTDQQREIWEFCRDNGPSTPSEIADEMGTERSNVHKQLKKLVDRRILKTRGGKYSLPFPMPSSPMDNGDNKDNVDNGDNGDNEE